MLCVLDSSAALAWVLPGEGDAANEALLDDVTEALTRDWDKHGNSVYARGAFCAAVRVRC